MAEWFKAPVLKTGVPARVPWVRIPPLPPVQNVSGTLGYPGLSGGMTCSLRHPMELYQFDLRVMAGGCGQTSVARQQWCVERLGQRDIGGVIGRQIVP